jgi:hypothetical protein
LDPLAFISKLIGTTAKVGAAFAIAGVAVYFGRRSGIGFFIGLNDVVYQAIVVAGLVGAGSVAVELVVACGRALRWLGGKITNISRKRAVHIRKRDNALRNMEALTFEYAQVLRFLKSNDRKRFIASVDSGLLYSMVRAGLLEIDDPNWSWNGLIISFQTMCGIRSIRYWNVFLNRRVSRCCTIAAECLPPARWSSSSACTSATRSQISDHRRTRQIGTLSISVGSSSGA